MADEVSNGATGAASGAIGGATTGSALGPWGTLAGGLIGGVLGATSGLLSSGGTSAAQQLDMLEKYYQPTKYGWSWAQLENQVALEAYRKQMASSADTELALSKLLNQQLPTAQVQGLKAAGLNPILAVLGQGFSPIHSSASAAGSVSSRVPGGLSAPRRSINSAGSAMDFAKLFSGAIDTEIENRQADTTNKEALTSNIRQQNRLIEAQADKTHAEADLIREKTGFGEGQVPEAMRPIRRQLQDWFTTFLNWIGYADTPGAVEPKANSAGSSSKAYDEEYHGKKVPVPSLIIPAGF